MSSRRMVIINSRRQFAIDDGPLVGPLTEHLWSLLTALSDGALWPTAKLAIEVWPSPDGEMTVTVASVYAAVSTLRKKANDTSFIKSYPSAGYMLDVDVVERRA